MNILTYIHLLAILFLSSHSVFAATIHCPNEIKTNQTLKLKINGWDQFIDDSNLYHHFNHITFYSGHPKEHASLAPDNENTKNKKMIWTFGQGPIWLACGYSNTHIQLIQELPNKIKKCSVTYNVDYSSILAIDCLE